MSINMKTVCELDRCTGCMACVDACGKSAIKIEDSLSSYNAVIDEKKCVSCNACHKVCQVNSPVKFSSVIRWYQGWANDESIRASSSSGGMATLLARTFIEGRGVVCSCVFENGEFGFQIAENIEEVQRFAGSKYVKSNPTGIYRVVKKHLDSGTRVLFIGLPCQVAAVKKYVGEQYEDKLYTIDLICHGTPSPRILWKYLEGKVGCTRVIKGVQFREKTQFRLRVNCENVVDKRVSDFYTMAFLKGVCYTENCYHCVYAQRERISDITLGDAWGSEMPKSEQEKGVSLILCQSKKGIRLIEQSDSYLEDINLEKAVDENQQLKVPSRKVKERDIFFYGIKRGKSFNRVMLECYPKEFLKNVVKWVIIKLGIHIKRADKH